MAIDKGKQIKIDGVSYPVVGKAVLVPRVITPPRIQTEPNRTFESLEEWEHYGMKSFVGGMGQKRFDDTEMYYDSFGINVLREREAKLSRVIEEVKDMTDLGVTLADLGGSCNMSIMQIYRDKLYFAANEGDWGTADGGKCRLWSWDGTTLTDLACTAGVSTLTVNTGAAAAPVDITVADGTQFTAGRYIYLTNNDTSNYEIFHIDSIAGNVLTCDTRGGDITWADGKTFTTTPFDFQAADNIVVHELQPTPYDKLPIKAGDGINSMAVIDDKLYIGTYTGFVFMYDGSKFYLQPPSVNTITYQGTSRLGGSINHQACAMLAYKDVLYVAFGRRLEKYDPNTGTGVNPWSGTLHTIRDAYTLNNMVLYGNAIYITSWHDFGDSAELYKYDGTIVTPVFRFPSRFEIHSAIVYDGKIFLAGGKYNYAGTAAVGQLYSYDGSTMRKIFSRPRDDEFETGRLNTFYKLMTWDDKLYFSDNYTTGLFCYDAEFDAIHRAYNKSDVDGDDGTLVRGIHAFKDHYYMTFTSKGLYRVKTTDVFDVGGENLCYGDFLYPYIQTSIFGDDYPNMEKVFYGIHLWHSPAIAGQRIYLYFSRNQGLTWSDAILLALTTNSTHTEYIFLEEGWNSLYGGFDDTPTGDYGYQGTDLSVIIAMKTSSNTDQFYLHGFALMYMPIADHQQRIRVTINCTDNIEYAPHIEDTDWGIQKMQALWQNYREQRPVVVEHCFDDKDDEKIMLITGYQGVGATGMMHESDPTNEYQVEGAVTLDLVEIGDKPPEQ